MTMVLAMQYFWKKQRMIILYGCIGVLSASLDVLVFHQLVTTLALNYLLANLFSVHIGILSSFLLNRQYTFRVKDRTLTRLVTFYAVGISGLVLSMLLLWFCAVTLPLDKTVIKLVTIPIIFLFQFTLNKLVTFKVS